MTQPTDQQIAADIDRAVTALNIALHCAANAGIKTEISTLDATRHNDKHRLEIVSVRLTREQEITP